jgi:hypothetical protein
MSTMIGESLAVDEDVIQEDYDEVIEEGSEDFVHQVHEGGRRVREAHWQH